MIVILDVANGIEAHMMVHLLQQSGIKAQINGQHPEEVAVELPEKGNFRVSVKPQDADEGKRLVAQWVSVKPTQEKEEEPETPAGKATYFMAGAAVAALALFLLFRFPGTDGGFDHNGDGELDEIYYRQGDLISKIEHDRNRDGDVDLRWVYGFDGVLHTMEADNDFNGTFEQIVEYEDGVPVAGRINSSGNGPRDIENNYMNGVLIDSKLYDPFTNIRKKIIIFDAFGKPLESELDTDGDGRLDQKTSYDAFGDPLL
ncbi:MAG: DUF2007 domain-containing protein [Gammaproteobacteria bacterium]|nr:DUF2007 domain-containing protein [Gammaproteobacteria bacterium]MCP4277231.1 DUF2007 domain-containing protein [Gammaproteobacteria bacterium]MCP4832853.1 DUF2007 domain-containing protein [Gammaproteobacteria bacterium]